MTFFIISTIAYIFGMSVACHLEIQNSGIFLLTSLFFLLGSLIPVWSRHGDMIQEGRIREALQEEDPLPATTMVFLCLAILFFGVFRYSYALYPLPANHLDKVMRSDDPFAKWTVVGRVIEEPNLSQDALTVLIQPETIQEFVKPVKPRAVKKGKKGGKKKGQNTEIASATDPVPEDDPAFAPGPEAPSEIRVDGGLIIASVFEDSRAFAQVKFNQRIQLSGRFNIPSSRRNPGSLDYQKTLINRGVYRTTRLTAKEGIFKELGSAGFGAWWYRFALYLRSEFLKVIKQTMPYPESSFLGGVLLGLKGGLPPYVTREFRMTGVSHVLAVSGLHVTIIAGLLYGLFTVFRVPIRVFAPLICFFLFTFALIVGWPSSAVRAALMNSLFVLSRAYLRDYGFKMSIIFSLGVAAVYILTMSPLQLTEPSFTLSFMAIYALAMFTDPSERLLRSTLRGAGLAFAVTVTIGFYLFLSINRNVVLYEYFFWYAGAFFVAMFVVSHRLSTGSSFQSFSFEMLPNWLRSFTASQFAIFLGMMGPLSAFYFGSMSLAAPLANMIAIPLIGIIVQLGLIAGIIGAFLPKIGIYLALILNAANWLAVKFFLGMAHFFAVLIPFPRVSQPGLGWVLAYYAILHLVLFWEDVWTYVSAIGGAIVDLWEDPDYKLSLGLLLGVVFGAVFFFVIMSLSKIQSRPEMRVTMLDVGFGSSLMIERDDKTVLVDAGLKDDLSEYDAGERTVEPALSSKNIRGIHAAILTTLLPEQVSGLFRVMENFRVNTLYAPFPIPTDGQTIGFHEFVARFSLSDRSVEAALKAGEILTAPPNYYWEQAFNSYNRLIKSVYQSGTNVRLLRAGTPIAGMEGVIEVVHPRETRDRFNAYYDAAVLFVRHGPFQMAYVPPNTNSWEGLSGETLNVLFVAGIPSPMEKFEQFFRKVKPENVVLSFRKPQGWLMDKYYLGRILDGRAFQFNKKSRDLPGNLLRTDRNGAVQIDVLKDRFQVIPFVTDIGDTR